MCNRVAEVAGEVMLHYISDKKNGVNINKSYIIYGGDRYYNINNFNNYKTPIDYINEQKLKKVRKRQY